MPAHRDPFRRVNKNFRIRPWLSRLDVTGLARHLESWSLEIMELERQPGRDPPPELVQRIGKTVTRLLRQAIRRL